MSIYKPASLGGAVCLALFAAMPPAAAQESGRRHFWSGDWYLTVGATGLVAPRFEGSGSGSFGMAPLVSLGRHGGAARFSSRNDSPSFAVVDTPSFRTGLAGKLVFRRDEDTSDDLKGLDPVPWGAELGGFAEAYPADWLRVRGEVRHGIHAHHGVVVDLTADAFADVTPVIRVSAGPRISFADADYFETYYGVDAKEAAASGLSEYDPGGGFRSAGFGGAVTWKTTDRMTTSLFAEYARLQGPAADSSLVRERGSRDQFTIGASATYRFDFTLD